MEKKTSFYKTMDERILKDVVDCYYNNYVGWNENAMLDGSDYFNPNLNEEEVIKTIIDDIMTSKNEYLLGEHNMAIETKHIHFMGRQRVEEIVEHRVKFRHQQDGSWLWE